MNRPSFTIELDNTQNKLNSNQISEAVKNFSELLSDDEEEEDEGMTKENWEIVKKEPVLNLGKPSTRIEANCPDCGCKFEQVKEDETLPETCRGCKLQ